MKNIFKVSVGICVKNSENTIKNAIDSVINQDYPHDFMEIIIVDGNSNDYTLSIIKDFISKTDIKIKIFQDKGNGLGAARQMVVNNSCGKYIVWVDADMYLPKNYVLKQVEYIEINPRIGAARGIDGINKIINNINYKREIKMVQLLEYISRLNNIYEKDTYKSPREILSTHAGIYRSKAIKDVGGYDKHIRGAGEDIDISARMRKKGWLLFLNQVEFYQIFRKTWMELWNQYFWYGYGAHYVYHKHKGLIILWQWIPLVALASGIRRSIRAYKVTHNKVALLIWHHFTFKKIAWCLGFIKSHIDKNMPPIL